MNWCHHKYSLLSIVSVNSCAPTELASHDEHQLCHVGFELVNFL
jgi:hypothetical protein